MKSTENTRKTYRGETMSNQQHYPPGPSYEQYSRTPQQLPKPPKKPMSKEARIGWLILGAVVFLLLGVAIGAGNSTTTTSTSSTPQPTVTQTVAGPAGAEVTVTPPPVTKTVPGPKVTVTAPPPQAAATISEGTWEVGVDVAPGRYKTVAAVESDGMCYWKITTTGKPDNIVDNDIVTGGRPTVTIKKGQDFTTQDCGTWKKVG